MLRQERCREKPGSNRGVLEQDQPTNRSAGAQRSPRLHKRSYFSLPFKNLFHIPLCAVDIVGGEDVMDGPDVRWRPATNAADSYQNKYQRQSNRGCYVRRVKGGCNGIVACCQGQESPSGPSSSLWRFSYCHLKRHSSGPQRTSSGCRISRIPWRPGWPHTCFRRAYPRRTTLPIEARALQLQLLAASTVSHQVLNKAIGG